MEITNVLSGATIALLLLIPSFIATWPIIVSKMQDNYPEEVRNGNVLYMFLSPFLDRKGIHLKQTPRQIMKHSLSLGLKDTVDRIVNPVVAPLKKTQDTVADTLETVTYAIQNGISIPMRSMFNLGTRLTKTLNVVFANVISVGVEIGNAIQAGLNALIAGTLVGLHIQTTIYNLAISSVKFFMWIVEMSGIAVAVAGGLMMLSLFTIIPGIVLVTLGGILTSIAANSEHVLRFA